MEYCSELNGNSRDQQSFGTSGKTKSAQASPRVKPKDRINVEKPGLSYADFHREIMKKVKDVVSKSPGNQKQQASRKDNDEDELVKYMSKLPNYLERGRHSQEKVLNVGVLDWGRLERWQSSQKQMPHVSGRSSISSSDFSSASSIEASSSNSSRRFIFSPDRQRMRRPSLQSHLKSFPIEGSSQVVKSLGESVGKLPHLGDSKSNTLKKESTVRTDQSFDKINQKIGSFECRRTSLDAKTTLESGTLSNGIKYEIQSSSPGKMKTQDAHFMKKTEMPQQGHPNAATDQDVKLKKNTVVLLLPREFPKNHLSVESNSSVSTTAFGERHSEVSRRSISVGTKDAALDSHVPHSCPLLHEEDSSKNLQGRHNCSTQAKSGESSERSHSVPRAARIGASPSRDSNVEDRESTVTSNKPNANGPFVGPDQKVNKVAVEKGRSTSPFRRLSFSMGKMGRSSNPKEVPIFSKPSLTYASGHSSSEYSVSSSGLDASNSDRSSSTSRARSSPLRRLLDPILKPKATNRNTIEPLPRDSISKDETSKSSDGQLYTSNVAGQPGRLRLDVTGCKTISINDSFQEKKQGSAVQALLRVAVKNGQPLLTFAVDNEKNVLAATMKISSTSRKEDYSCVYTFFAIKEVKKKNGMWSKGQRHDYIPNVVAQMKVFGNPNLSTENLLGRFSLREFVLFSVNLRQSDQQTSDYQPNNELAAMVIKFPLRNRTRTLLEEYPGYIEKDSLPEVMEKLQNLTSISTQDISATVILPSGDHTVPRKGEPSSLIQRWKSGGSCDCGGWDLGCKLQILANRNQLSKTAGTSKANKFELFSQEGVQETRPFFTIAPFKDGIYSVEFHSSLSNLQAFSICIAVLDSREEKTLKETISMPGQLDGEVLAKYVQYPPVSPAGRV